MKMLTPKQTALMKKHKKHHKNSLNKIPIHFCLTAELYIFPFRILHWAALKASPE